METRKMIAGMVVVVLVLMSGTARATQYYVSPDGSDTNSGTSWPTALRTLPEAMERATSDGDVVDVNEGTYYGRCNEVPNPDEWEYPIDPRADIIIRSTDPNDPCVVKATKISGYREWGCVSGQDEYTVVCKFDSDETRDCKIKGLTVLASPLVFPVDSNAIRCYKASPTIEKCRIVGDPCDDSMFSDLIGIICNDSNALIKDCTITKIKNGYGHAIELIGNSQIDMEHCKIANTEVNGATVNCAVYICAKDTNISDCTVSNNNKRGVYIHETDVNISDCNIFGNEGIGLHCSTNVATTVTVTDSIFSGNTGGGIYHAGGTVGSIKMHGCTIKDNGISSRGGGIDLHNSNQSLIKDCNFVSNRGPEAGGVYISAGCNDVNFVDCIVTDNNSKSTAGGFYIAQNQIGPINIIRCTIRYNITDGDSILDGGGGICSESWEEVTLRSCTITGNVALGTGVGNAGGGIYTDGGMTITNSLIAGNKTLRDGGGLSVDNERPSTIRNCTIAGNFADAKGGGVFEDGGSSDIDVNNCLIWGNKADGNGPQMYLAASSKVGVSYSDIQDCNGSGAGWPYPPGTDDGNNIDENPWFYSAGQWVDVNRALGLDGTDDYVEVDDDASLDFGSGKFSVSLWFKTTDTDGELVDKSGGGGGRATGYTILMGTFATIDDGELGWRIRDGSKCDLIKTDNTYNDGNWHHFVSVRNGSGSANLNIYVDAVDVSTTSVKNQGAGNISNSYNLSMGAKYDAGDTNQWENFLDGIMDEVMIFNRALDSNDVAELYKKGSSWALSDSNLVSYWNLDGDANDSKGSNDGTVYGGAEWTVGLANPNEPNAWWETGNYHLRSSSPCIDAADPCIDYSGELDIDLEARVVDGDNNGSARADIGADEFSRVVSHWKLDEGEGTRASDYFGDNHGTLNGNPTWVTGKIGSYAIDFDGTDDRVDVGNDSSLNPSALTVSLWFMADDDDRSIITKGTSRGTTNQRDWDVFGTGTKLKWLGSDGSSNIWTTEVNYPSLGQWHHVAGTWDGTTDSNGVDLYLDGSLVDSATASNTNLATLHNVYIGGKRPSGAYEFDGKIDDVRIYDRDLSADEVGQIYQNGL